MNNDWEKKLQEDFPFMRWKTGDGRDAYQMWGFECCGGWYQLLRDLCEGITARFAQDGISPKDIDLEPIQIKEKFGTLRFYYGYKGAPRGIPAIDNLSTGESIRMTPGGAEPDPKKKALREDISKLVQEAEDRSAHTCEYCGAEGQYRNYRGWIYTLCDECWKKRCKDLDDDEV